MLTILICHLWLLRDVTQNTLKKSSGQDLNVSGKLCEIAYNK